MSFVPFFMSKKRLNGSGQNFCGNLQDTRKSLWPVDFFCLNQPIRMENFARFGFQILLKANR